MKKCHSIRTKKKLTFFLLVWYAYWLCPCKMLLWKAGKIERDFENMKWHVKMPFDLEKKRTDIFPSFGVSLCALSLQNAAFERQARSKLTLKK